MHDDNLIEYADAALYDDENSAFEPDGPFFHDLILRVGQPALELACGTGRLTIPLAQAGIDITGLDITPGMLSRARQKAAGLPVRWIEADARTFRLEQQFKVIFGGGFFQHLLERPDQEAVLRRVREHLAPGGVFAFNVFFPHADSLIASPDEQDWFSYENARGQLVTVTGTDHYDPIRQVRTETAIRRWTGTDGREVVRRAPLQQRMFFPAELDALLHYNGFSVSGLYGDYDSRPLRPDDRLMIVVCQGAD
jgi:SAM-dependent methyltransferase